MIVPGLIFPYWELNPGHNLGVASPLFTKVEESDIELRKKELGPADLK